MMSINTLIQSRQTANTWTCDTEIIQKLKALTQAGKSPNGLASCFLHPPPNCYC